MNSKMAFAHVIRDDADKIVMVHLDKCVSLRSTVYRMNIETYEELVSLSDRYEESIVTSVTPMRKQALLQKIEHQMTPIPKQNNE